MTAAGPSDKFNSSQVTSPRCRAKVIPSIAKLPTGESRALWCWKLLVNTSVQTSHLLDTVHQGIANCNNLSAATEQSEFDNQYLLISFTPKTQLDFSACPWGILCNLHLKVKKKGKPTLFHYPKTAAPNVTTPQVRPQLQRLITGQWSSSCHFLLAPRRFYSLSDLRIVLSPSIWTAFSPISKYILTSPSVHVNPHPTEKSEIKGVEISFWHEKWKLLLKGPHTIF